jgi:hypothetical protein
LNNAQSGVIRVAALRRTGLDRPYPAGDLVLMAQLALIGGFRLLPEVLLYRRIGPETTTRNLSMAEARHFLDPTNRATRDANVWRRHLDYLATVTKARIAPREKLICLAHALRHANWDRSQLWRELVGSTRREADAS